VVLQFYPEHLQKFWFWMCALFYRSVAPSVKSAASKTHVFDELLCSSCLYVNRIKRRCAKCDTTGTKQLMRAWSTSSRGGGRSSTITISSSSRPCSEQYVTAYIAACCCCCGFCERTRKQRRLPVRASSD